MKNKGFSLIEVCIGIALVGIMIGIGGPKVRRFIASGKDTKAIATLGALRTASELYYSEHGSSPATIKEEGTDIVASLKKLEEYINPKTFNNIKDGKIEIGGYMGEEHTVKYGGEMAFTFVDPNTSEKGDGVNLWFAPTEGQEYDMKGNKWSEY